MIKNMFKSSKGQAAFEFLTTYGWAFLVILIMVGTLAYFGILNPSNILPNRCNMGAEFQCLDHQIAAGLTPNTGTLRLRLKNNAGESVNIALATSIVLGSESTTQYSCALSTIDGVAPAFPVVWAPAQIKDFFWITCNSAAAGMAAGSKGKVLVTINYYSTTSGNLYTKQVKGQVFTSVI